VHSQALRAVIGMGAPFDDPTIDPFRAAFDAAPEAMLIFDDAGRLVEANAAACLLCGVARLDLLGRPVNDFLAPGREGVAQQSRLTFQSMGQLAGEFQMRRSDGEVRYVECKATAHFLPGRHLAVVRDITAHKSAQAQTARQLSLLSALRSVDRTITASRDLRVTLDVILAQVALHLGADAGAVARLHPLTQALEYVAWRGFRRESPPRAHLYVGAGPAGQVALDGRPLWVPNLAAACLNRPAPFPAEHFHAYYAVPLQAQGHLYGVLEVFHRLPLDLTGDALEFLAALGDQAADAIEHTALLEDLQRSNLELALAYDITLEGWSRALDLRDRETEGHTRRVTERTVALATMMGLGNGELVHIRRGALLHDIGKMGIPDAILLKPGPLTEDEWAVMRRHPVYAYELLHPIAFLRPALDIPYCHHEHWNGGGYPRGLWGEQIPRAARIFAVVDVWDALTSDRPYRRAWPETQVLGHIEALAGTVFDPQVVEIFLQSQR
jgi:PAS domain S-box-containing protein